MADGAEMKIADGGVLRVSRCLPPRAEAEVATVLKASIGGLGSVAFSYE